jgi:serine/threonine protein kinase
MPLEPGSRIGSYEVLACIGAGGMDRFKREAQVLASLNQCPTQMPLEPGSRIGSYEVLACIGAGGMDRFKREAQVLASLNHPHIAQIHGLEEQDGCSAIVMELVDGETLDARLKPRAPAETDGPRRFSGALPLDDALTRSTARPSTSFSAIRSACRSWRSAPDRRGSSA